MMRQLATLEAWRCAECLARSAYRLTLEPPLCRHFGLADQIRRAALSVPANMAEGYALGTTPQFIRCLRIALGSVAELQSHLNISKDLNLTSARVADESLDLCGREIRLLIGLLRRLERRSGSPFPSPHSLTRRFTKSDPT